MSESPEKKYWFYAKEYGYGWGLPACWQGWAVFVGYLALVAAGIPVALTANHELAFAAYAAVLSIILIAICWLKGEPLAWRWGDKSATESPKKNRGYLVFHLFLGPLILGAACWLYIHPPSNVNRTYGYRTATSLRSQEIWDEAQQFSATVMIYAGLVTIALQALVMYLMKPKFSLLAAAIAVVIAVTAVVPITENHLKKTFDAKGKRIRVTGPPAPRNPFR